MATATSVRITLSRPYFWQATSLWCICVCFTVYDVFGPKHLTFQPFDKCNFYAISLKAFSLIMFFFFSVEELTKHRLYSLEIRIFVTLYIFISAQWVFAERGFVTFKQEYSFDFQRTWLLPIQLRETWIQVKKSTCIHMCS